VPLLLQVNKNIALRAIKILSGIWRCVDLGLTDVSEERVASIFRVEKSASREPA
jgi:hypothetical protein